MADASAKFDPQHVLIVEDGKERNEIVLTAENYSVGRAKSCDIRLYSQFVSRHHATLLRCVNVQGEFFYRMIDGDLQGNLSSNGLLINGRKLTTRDLMNGDEVIFGPQVFCIYQFRHRHRFPTMPSDDPFDITLIDPSMMIPTQTEMEETKPLSDEAL